MWAQEKGQTWRKVTFNLRLWLCVYIKLELIILIYIGSQDSFCVKKKPPQPITHTFAQSGATSKTKPGNFLAKMPFCKIVQGFHILRLPMTFAKSVWVVTMTGALLFFFFHSFWPSLSRVSTRIVNMMHCCGMTALYTNKRDEMDFVTYNLLSHVPWALARGIAKKHTPVMKYNGVGVIFNVLGINPYTQNV